MRTSSVAQTLRTAFAAGAASMALLATAPAIGTPAAQTTQVPGYYRQAVGDTVVTALYDGYIDIDSKLLHGLRTQDIQRLIARMFIAHDKGTQTAVNGFLVHTGDRLVLVDTGAAQCFGPTLGKVVDNIRAAGYTPEDVDTVLLTHMHADHLCGLLGADGKAAFTKATVWASKADADFWLNQQTADAAPEGTRLLFKMARDAIAPYTAAGNFKTFEAGTQVVPGIEALATPGHTPGHSSYLLTSRGQHMLVWGDIVHSHAVQFVHPEVSIEFDTDQKRAIASRKAILQRAAQNAWWVAGAHLPFPGLGHVRKDAQGYAWVPAEFGPIRQDR
jgi:glyoxylase-like metal-dependent hydrolase (beta-lactamase superfamily II)